MGNSIFYVGLFRRVETVENILWAVDGAPQNGRVCVLRGESTQHPYIKHKHFKWVSNLQQLNMVVL